MSELLGTFNENEFTVLQQKQSAPPSPKGKDGKPKPPQNPEGKPEDKKPDDTEKPEDNQDVEEIPLKSKEEILADLEKAGVKSDSGEEQPEDEQGEDKPYDIGDKKSDSGEPKDEKGEGKGEDGEPKDETSEPKENGEPKDETGDGKKEKGKSDKQGKIDAQEAKEGERREMVKAKNFITEKINQYNTILVKHDDKLPLKVKKSLNKAIEELTEKTNSI